MSGCFVLGETRAGPPAVGDFFACFHGCGSLCAPCLVAIAVRDRPAELAKTLVEVRRGVGLGGDSHRAADSCMDRLTAHGELSAMSQHEVGDWLAVDCGLDSTPRDEVPQRAVVDFYLHRDHVVHGAEPRSSARPDDVAERLQLIAA